MEKKFTHQYPALTFVLMATENTAKSLQFDIMLT